MDVKLTGRSRQRSSLARKIVGLIREYSEAKVRTVSESEVERLLKRHWKAVRLAFKSDDTVEVTARLIGGFVPNSYRYKASADHVRLSTVQQERPVLRALGDGKEYDLVTTITCGREGGITRSYGRGTAELHRVVREGQTDGRIVCADGVWK